MNIRNKVVTSAEVFYDRLQQLQGLQTNDLRQKAFTLARQYPECSIYGPELIGDKLVIEISADKQKIDSEHLLPVGYCNEW